MKVVVTGAGGFVGSHLVESQARAGHDVRALDLRTRSIEHLSGSPNVEILAGDLTDSDFLQSALEGADIVYHLASIHLEISVPDETYWRVNVEGVRNLLKMCHAAGVDRVVHCSSIGVYGSTPEEFPSNEDSPCHPQSIYERTKFEGERVVREVVAETGLPVTIVRPGWVYGPRCPRTLKLFKAIRSGRFLLVGDGQAVRQPVYVEDIVRALEHAGQSPCAVGETFVIAGPKAVTIKELTTAIARALGKPPVRLQAPYPVVWPAALGAELLGKVIGKEPPISRRSLKFFDGNAAFDLSKAERLIDFKPLTDLDEGLSRSLSWFQVEGLV
ncbi:MAG: NAD-dependent epimerase/dehydratase family protein [Nitrolancea sp.]